jgi:hypothetical protein
MAQSTPLLIKSCSLPVPSEYGQFGVRTPKSLTWNFGECEFPEFRSVVTLKNASTYIEFHVLTPNETCL